MCKHFLVNGLQHFQLEENAWNLAKESNDVESYEKFNQTFSEGEYSSLASSRKDEIIHNC